ncbi:MAG: CapA family protein [bacterium]
MCLAKLGEPYEKLTEKYIEVVKIIRDADISIGNLECVICDEGLEEVDKVRYGGGLYYRCSPGHSVLIRDYAFDVLSIANNYMMDYGWEGLCQTMNSLDNMGVKYVGAGCDIDSALKPIILYIKCKRSEGWFYSNR